MYPIQPLALQHLPEIMILIRKAIAEMELLQIFQWDELYPDQEKIRTDLLNQTLFGWTENSSLCAIVVLDTIQSPLYAQINWRNNDSTPLVIHRLCVDPEHQRKGIAKKMILFAEEYARLHHFKSIRLDAFIQNPFSEKLYRGLHYEERGIVTFRKGNFYCFEKSI
jgi:GNAT superfamily N-acetyltransferase